MNKTYIAPSIEVLNVEANNIIATSGVPGIDGSVEVPDNGEKGREDNTPSRPNIWEQGW